MTSGPPEVVGRQAGRLLLHGDSERLPVGKVACGSHGPARAPDSPVGLRGETPGKCLDRLGQLVLGHDLVSQADGPRLPSVEHVAEQDHPSGHRLSDQPR